MEDLERQRRIWNQFDPKRLPTDSEYVDFGPARGEEVLDPLLGSLRLADHGQPIARLFGGTRGSGKTTELKRFERQLEVDGFTAIYIDVDRLIPDLNNCDFADFVIAIALGLRERLIERGISGHTAFNNYLESKVREIVGFFGQEIKIPGGKIKGGSERGGAEVEIRFERRVGSRDRLQAEFEALAADAVKAVSELIARTAADFVGRSFRGLVLLVDGGDKILAFGAGNNSESQHKRIFANHATQLCGLGCHVVYSVPLSFCYSPEVQIFNSTAGAAPIVLPMTSLRGKKREPANAHTVGYKLFCEIIELRLKTIEEQIDSVIDPKATHALILASGGSPTALMTLFQESFVRNGDALPVREDSVTSAVRTLANALNRQIKSEYWTQLRLYREPNDERGGSQEFMDCLYFQYLYEYMNGGSWFEVNPVLKGLRQLSA